MTVLFNFFTFTLNVYASCPVSGTYYITEDEQWDTSPDGTPPIPWQPIEHEKIVVTQGATFTIQELSIDMSKETHIIVEPGSKLVLNSSMLSLYSDCDFDNDEYQVWEGIIVEGVENEPQFIDGILPDPNFDAHGAVIFEFDGSGLNQSKGVHSIDGGIVMTFGSTFKNNLNSIIIEGVDDDTSATKLDKSEFYWDKPLRNIDSDYDPYIYQHVVLDNVDHPQIEGCSFYLDDDNADGDRRGTGIHLTNASALISKRNFTGLDANGCPEFDDFFTKEPEFFDLTYGINYNASAQYEEGVVMGHVTFTNNFHSVRLFAGNNHLLTNNEYVLDANHNLGTDLNDFYFLKVKEAESFIITEEFFETDITIDQLLRYVYFEDVNATENRHARFFYNDHVGPNNHYIANDFSGNNDKLEVFCNAYESFEFDWYVDNGSLGQQGTFYHGAANSFTSGSSSQIYIGANINGDLTYYYGPSEHIPTEFTHGSTIYIFDDQRAMHDHECGPLPCDGKDESEYRWHAPNEEELAELKPGNVPEGVNLTLYPNPARIDVNIKVDQGFSNKTVSLLNLDGRNLKTVPVDDGEATMNIQDLTPGTYIVLIHNSEQEVIANKKLIVQ